MRLLLLTVVVIVLLLTIVKSCIGSLGERERAKFIIAVNQLLLATPTTQQSTLNVCPAAVDHLLLATPTTQQSMLNGRAPTRSVASSAGVIVDGGGGRVDVTDDVEEEEGDNIARLKQLISSYAPSALQSCYAQPILQSSVGDTLQQGLTLFSKV